MRCFLVVIFSSLGFLAGCAASHPPDLAMAGAYSGQVVAVRRVTGGALTARITDLLGQPAYEPLTAAKEVIVRLADGEVKAFVPPPGAVPVGLAPGAQVMITETPYMRISLR